MTTSGAQQGIRPGVCLSTSRPASPFIGQIIYMTDVNQSAVWNGTSWEGLDRSRDRNAAINGAMQVHQRGTSTASITTTGYYTADRYQTFLSSLGTWTQSVEADGPTGSGLRKSLRMLCTTADASPDSADILVVNQRLEGQNLQQFLKGTSSAKPFALSFWVKSNVTGTYIAELFDFDNSRLVSVSYTISTSATWEKKTIIFSADTTGALDNDNAVSIGINFILGAGSAYRSGTLNNAWDTANSFNRAIGQTNLASAINNYWQVTGVQFEAGVVATPFEFESMSETIAKCQRYYYRMNAGSGAYTVFGMGQVDNTTNVEGVIPFPVAMRTSPTSLDTSGTASHYGVYGKTIVTTCTAVPALATSNPSSLSAGVRFTATGQTAGEARQLLANNTSSAYLGFNAEL